MKIAKKFTVKGCVQGVGYRYFTLLLAEKLGVHGYVTNLYNGDVEAYAIGTEETLLDFKNALTNGPRHARVDTVLEESCSVDDRYVGDFIVEH